MSPEFETARARRYLLGNASEEERSAIELEYFNSEEAVDRIAAAEDELIEDYLSNRLGPAERGRFERDYLPIAHRQRRVETIRRLMAGGARPGLPRTAASSTAVGPVHPTSRNRRLQWLAAAAALFLVAAGTLWVLAPSRSERAAVAANPPTAPKSPDSAPVPEATTPSRSLPEPPRPQVFAVSISPATVRSAAASPSVVIPAGTDLIALNLEGDADGRKLSPARGAVRTVAGDEIWQGPATAGGDLPRGVVARLDVPAAQLVADDYVITLFGIDGRGVEQEWSRYFVRVRAP